MNFLKSCTCGSTRVLGTNICVHLGFTSTWNVIVVAEDTQRTRTLKKTPGIITVMQLKLRSGYQHGREGEAPPWKKHVELDAQEQSFGSMKAVLCSDIKKYAKDPDPTTGWEGQPRHERKWLFRRLYTSKHCNFFLCCMCCRTFVMFRMILKFYVQATIGRDMCTDMQAVVPDIHWDVNVDM